MTCNLRSSVHVTQGPPQMAPPMPLGLAAAVHMARSGQPPASALSAPQSVGLCGTFVFTADSPVSGLRCQQFTRCVRKVYHCMLPVSVGSNADSTVSVVLTRHGEHRRRAASPAASRPAAAAPEAGQERGAAAGGAESQLLGPAPGEEGATPCCATVCDTVLQYWTLRLQTMTGVRRCQ